MVLLKQDWVKFTILEDKGKVSKVKFIEAVLLGNPTVLFTV